MKKTLKHFEKIILELNKEGKSSYYIQKALHRDYGFKTYSGNVRTFLRKRGLGKYIIDTFEKSLEKKAKINFLPLQLGDVPDTYANINEISGKLKYKPNTSVIDGVNNFVKWYKDYYKI